MGMGVWAVAEILRSMEEDEEEALFPATRSPEEAVQGRGGREQVKGESGSNFREKVNTAVGKRQAAAVG